MTSTVARPPVRSLAASTAPALYVAFSAIQEMTRLRALSYQAQIQEEMVSHSADHLISTLLTPMIPAPQAAVS